MNTIALVTRTAMSNTAVSVVEVSGVLDLHTADDFEAILEDSFRKKQYKIILNLEKLTYISSAGIGILVGVIKDVRKNRGDIKIANVNPEIYKVFDLLDLQGFFHFHKTETEAAAEF
jgi:anti-sigma B factor antagonist